MRNIATSMIRALKKSMKASNELKTKQNNHAFVDDVTSLFSPIIEATAAESSDSIIHGAEEKSIGSTTSTISTIDSTEKNNDDENHHRCDDDVALDDSLFGLILVEGSSCYRKNQRRRSKGKKEEFQEEEYTSHPLLLSRSENDKKSIVPNDPIFQKLLSQYKRDDDKAVNIYNTVPSVINVRRKSETSSSSPLPYEASEGGNIVAEGMKMMQNEDSSSSKERKMKMIDSLNFLLQEQDDALLSLKMKQEDEEEQKKIQEMEHENLELDRKIAKLQQSYSKTKEDYDNSVKSISALESRYSKQINERESRVGFVTKRNFKTVTKIQRLMKDVQEIQYLLDDRDMSISTKEEGHFRSSRTKRKKIVIIEVDDDLLYDSDSDSCYDYEEEGKEQEEEELCGQQARLLRI